MASTVAANPLRSRARPEFGAGERVFRLVDLFSGCGGITLGFAQAAHARNLRFEVPLAVDFDELAADVYRRNFPEATHVATAAVEAFFDGDLDAPLTLAEHRTRGAVQAIDALVGGPPCQGHSNLNNHTRRVDEKNALYLRMARAAEVLRPGLVLIENVPSVVRDRHDGEGVVDRADRHLRSLGYRTAQRVVPLADLGVAQSRRRHILMATEQDGVHPDEVLADAMNTSLARDLRWAIGDLVDAPESGLLDRRPRPTPVNRERMQHLLDNGIYDLPNEHRPECHQRDHKYKSMYGRLNWDDPAQTITSGYGSIGQGRYMHPDQPRALTAHEAARIQGFPDYFDFSACPTGSALATMIGNAVPPQLGEAVLGSFLRLGRATPARITEPAQPA